VLDACAAPGGKTAHMLEACPDLAGVTAVDRDPDRLEQVAAMLGRLGLDAALAPADAGRLGDWWDGRPFDRILIDAPCSATGVIRRHPDIKVLRRAADLPVLEQRQAELLQALWPALAPGGLLVYASCSVLRSENERQIERFVGATPDAVGARFGSDTHFQVLPGEANMDGFYYASVTKQPEP
jgi:16S rRNA (cytosine967-C5)-methyltransferase